MLLLTAYLCSNHAKRQRQERRRRGQTRLEQPEEERLRELSLLVLLTKSFILRQYLLYWSRSTLCTR